MSETRKPYPFDAIEEKWQAFWEENATFAVPNPGGPGFDPSKPKYYVLDMFPYPSAAGLHVGTPEGYTATDIVARYKRAKGFNVLHPMGWDAFGLPAEQYAIKTGQHPGVTTRENVGRFKAQLKKIGFAYDWSREINTTDPGYYKWTQWIFLQIYNAWFDPETRRARPIRELRVPDGSPAERAAFIDSQRLAYVSEAPVNWCPGLGTVLANEEVIDGKSEVGGFPVVRRPMRQWKLRITAYADRLIEELEGLDWPESIKTLQRNWIGRSEGAEVIFIVAGRNLGIPVFTTRPDTLFGATYMVLAPENPLVDELTAEEQRGSVDAYRALIGSKSDLDRTDLAKDKSGVFTGACAINPVNAERIPIWIADYVLMGYGTGAIMAVPAHDERDFEFAQKFGLEIRQVVRGPERAEGTACYSGEGTAIHSPLIEGLPTAEAKRKITAWLEERGLGKKTVNYKLRDWLFSRQRYWGEPFPVIWRGEQHEAIPESDLPVVPPALEDFKPSGTGEPPLAKAKEWLRHGKGGLRETNTMPQWAGSCWYYLRFCDPGNGERFAGEKAERYWMGSDRPGGVDLYIGGTEHAVLHLLYARFWHKVLHDLGHVSKPEPFQRLVNQGIILGEDGQKMSKSRGNVVNPDDVIAEYGADSFRLYEMFMGPLEQMKPWSITGVEGVFRFLARVWRLVMQENQEGTWMLSASIGDVPPDKRLLKVMHASIKKVTEDIETLSFNTAIAQMMIFVNALTNAPVRPVAALFSLLQLLNPFAPHLTEELWSALRQKYDGFEGLLADAKWPVYDESILIEDEVEIVVQVNGKVRDRIVVKKDAANAAVQEQALAAPKVREFLGDKTVRKVVVVPGKLVNIVAG